MKALYTLASALLVAATALGQSVTTATVISGLQYPVAFDKAPDGRFFITEKGDGSNTASQKARIQVYSSGGILSGTFYDLSDSTNSTSERGVLGIALDPDFATNHYVYVYYNHRRNNDERIRLIRLTESGNTGSSPAIIFDLDVADNIPGNHVGGNLHFRPSEPGKIYFTIGDLGTNQTNPTANFANKLTNPYGKFLRINKDGSIPADNPFYDDGNPLSGNCDWIWSYGHRNPFDFCFGTNDSLYSSENGLTTWDEANLIRKGGYYGWAECEGNYLNSSTTATCNVANAIAPITDWGGGGLPSVTGILYYSGTGWSALNNHLLVADYNNGRIHDCVLGNAPFYNTVSSKTVLGDFSSGGLTTLRQSPEGCIYAMEGGYTTNGKIYRICPANVGISELAAAPVSLQLYPNPASGSLTAELFLEGEHNLELSVSDLCGKRYALGQFAGKAGENKLQGELARHGLAAGMYVVELKDAQTQQLLGKGKLCVE